MRSIYENKGIKTDKAVYTLCQTAVRATHTWFVLQELLGYDNELISIDNQQGFNGSIDLNRRVVSLSKSRWDFISGIGDVFLGGFFDYSSYRDQVAMGYYTTLEILLFSFNVPLEVSMGQSFSEGEFLPIFLEFGVKFGSDIPGLD